MTTHIIYDLFGEIQLLSDGSFARTPTPTPTYTSSDTVLWKDVIFDTANNLRLRLYKPRNNNNHHPLPVLIYYHAGGFCIGSRTRPAFHNLCLCFASELNVLVVAPDYRLAPEHRLPAAVEDAVSSFEWARAQTESPDQFLAGVADFNNVFVSGDSAGGTLVHHLASRGELGVKGLILLYPFFGGEERTRSEVEFKNGMYLSLEESDMLWKLSLPVGASRDHPLAKPRVTELTDVPMFVAVAGADLLKDRGLEYAERVKEMGRDVEVMIFEGQPHGFLLDPRIDAGAELVRAIGMFVKRNVDDRT